MVEKKQFYEKRAQRYTKFDKQGYLRYLRATKLVDFKPGTKILDIGCKHAYLRDILADKGLKCSYCGVDISEKVIDSIKAEDGTFKRCDVMDGIPFGDAEFDYVFCLELIEHVENPSFLLKEIGRVLKDSGTLLLSAPNPHYWLATISNLLRMPDTEGHIHSFTPQNMKALLGFCGFETEERKGTYCIVPYTPHGIKTDNYFMFQTNLFFLTTSYIYKISKHITND